MSYSFNSVKVTELPPVAKELPTRLIICNSGVCLDMFDRFPFYIWDGLCILIRPVPEVSLLL